VAMTPENLNALISVARELQMQPVLPVPIDSLADLELLATWHRERRLQAFALTVPTRMGLTLDILLFPPVDFSRLRDNAVTFTVHNTPMVLASIDDLIALKKAAGRPIDLADVEHLEKLRF
ncbi:MAG: hypothetical protein Q8O31_05790, partial [Rhodocyclaceae bacterium]|nr:hypothetical protein [Rhodocyclaceae bacterium]